MLYAKIVQLNFENEHCTETLDDEIDLDVIRAAVVSFHSRWYKEPVAVCIQFTMLESIDLLYVAYTASCMRNQPQPKISHTCKNCLDRILSESARN